MKIIDPLVGNVRNSLGRERSLLCFSNTNYHIYEIYLTDNAMLDSMRRFDGRLQAEGTC